MLVMQISDYSQLLSKKNSTGRELQVQGFVHKYFSRSQVFAARFKLRERCDFIQGNVALHLVACHCYIHGNVREWNSKLSNVTKIQIKSENISSSIYISARVMLTDYYHYLFNVIYYYFFHFVLGDLSWQKWHTVLFLTICKKTYI